MTQSTQTYTSPSRSTSPRLDFERVGPIFALVFVDVLGLTVILPLLHLYAAAFGASPLEIGVVAAAFPLSQLIGVPTMGALSDRFGRKPLLIISQVTTCLSFIMLGLANSLGMIILSRVIDGLFGANLATAQAALSDITTDETRAQGLGLTGAAFGLGFIFGPIISVIALESSGSFAIPAFSAAIYSFFSILLTVFVFKETLPPEKRGPNTGRRAAAGPVVILRYMFTPVIGLLLVLMFAQQLIFFGFENLLGLFTLTRLGILGGNALLFIIIGVILVTVQMRYIGKWSRKYGEARVVSGALALLSGGLILLALTPEQPQPFYVQRIVAYDLREQAYNISSEAIIGEINVDLPAEGNNGVGGIAWMLVALVPLSIGGGLIRPSINTLLTKGVQGTDFGRVLGVSAAFVSAANAAAPLIGGLLFQAHGATPTFLLGGALMGVLALLSMVFIPRRQPEGT